MPVEIIDYLPINDNLLVIVNSPDLAIFREASHSCGLAAPEDRHFKDIPFWNKILGFPRALLGVLVSLHFFFTPNCYVTFSLDSLAHSPNISTKSCMNSVQKPMMTSKEVAKCDAVENRRRSPLDHLPPPANSNKPLTPFSIEDILNKPSVKRSYTICGTAHLISSSEKHRPSSIPLSSRALLTQTSPLCALEELASKTFKGLEVSVLQAAEGTFAPPNNAVGIHILELMQSFFITLWSASDIK